jgi:hypothetical protein
MQASRIAFGLFAAFLSTVGGCSRSEAAPSPRHEARAALLPAANASYETANYKVRLEPVGTFKKDEQGVVNVVLETKGEYHINDKYPYKFAVQDPAPEGISYPKKVVRREDGKFETRKAVLPVPFVPGKTGDLPVGGTFSLSVCTDANCLMDKQSLEITVKVN